jgi:hypothetical protein
MYQKLKAVLVARKVGQRTEETGEILQRRIEGQQKAHERELVRCAARRGVAFDFLLKTKSDEPEERRKSEAVMQSKVTWWYHH